MATPVDRHEERMELFYAGLPDPQEELNAILADLEREAQEEDAA